MEKEFVKIGDMKGEDLKKLPLFTISVIRRQNRDRKTNKPTTLVHFVELVLHPKYSTIRFNITQAVYALIDISKSKENEETGNVLKCGSYVLFSKGKMNDEKEYFLVEAYITPDVTLHQLLTDDEAKVIKQLIAKGYVNFVFQDRPDKPGPDVGVSVEE